MRRQPGSSPKHPAVLGAIIDLGYCLNLTDPANSALVQSAYEAHLQNCHQLGVPVAENKGPESKARFLDCAVINQLHKLRREAELPAFDTVRGFFIEGQPLYPTAGLRSLDHVQICVRHPQSILGFFRPNPARR